MSLIGFLLWHICLLFDFQFIFTIILLCCVCLFLVVAYYQSSRVPTVPSLSKLCNNSFLTYNLYIFQIDRKIFFKHKYITASSAKKRVFNHCQTSLIWRCRWFFCIGWWCTPCPFADNMHSSHHKIGNNTFHQQNYILWIKCICVISKRIKLLCSKCDRHGVC